MVTPDEIEDATMRDVILEMRRDDAGFYLLDNPAATDDEIVRGLFQLAKDRRTGPQGKGILIHDESGQDRSLDEFLVIVRHEIKTGTIRK
jgi:hypothetical protein